MMHIPKYGQFLNELVETTFPYTLTQPDNNEWTGQFTSLAGIEYVVSYFNYEFGSYDVQFFARKKGANGSMRTISSGTTDQKEAFTVLSTIINMTIEWVDKMEGTVHDLTFQGSKKNKESIEEISSRTRIYRLLIARRMPNARIETNGNITKVFT